MITSARPLAALESLDGYRQFFMDGTLWRPFVERVCRGSGWTCNLVRPGVAGTFPTFIVDEQQVIKFFGPLFDGKTCWRVEQEAAQLMEDLPAVPVARLLASGVLEMEPGWYYLVFKYVPGVSIGEVYAEVPLEDKLSLARWLGEWLPRMHRIKVRDGTTLPALSVGLTRGWFSTRWPEERRKWPVHLAGQVEEYLSANAGFLQSGSDCFIHADLTRDHIIGRLADGHWSTLGIIDFGDAMLANIYYELTALRLNLFDCDKHLL
ncbi:MAG TPA: aminoglycoside phosphotransferase family protein, partial [Anaerolineales bacterium]